MGVGGGGEGGNEALDELSSLDKVDILQTAVRLRRDVARIHGR